MTLNKWNLINILNLSSSYLSDKQIENARLNAELLIGYVLKMDRVQLYMNFEKPLSTKEVDIIRSLLQRRAQHEPLQYITGETEFYSLKFKVNRHTLIPRPETEILVEKIIEQCNKQKKISILDIGTGSGNIAITIAKYVSNAFILGIDIQSQALKIASENANWHHVQNQIRFKPIDLFDVDLTNKLCEKFDIIVSNPPYIPQDDFNNLPPEVKNFEPYIALNGGKNGLTFYHRVLQISNHILKENGTIALEISYGKANQIKELFQSYLFKDIEVFNDLNGIERVVIARKP